MIVELKKSIDLVSLVESSGVALTRSGTRHVGLCPFHTEKTPSFFVFPGNKFHCFGCGEHGDCIDFVQKFHGLSFQEALKHLGIEQGELTQEAIREIEKRKLERQKIKAQQQFEIDLQNTLLTLISATHAAMKGIITIDDFELSGDVLQPLAWWEYALELISFGTDNDRRLICKEFKDQELIIGERLFKPEFSYSAWLKEINKNEEPKNTESKRITISIK